MRDITANEVMMVSGGLTAIDIAYFRRLHNESQTEALRSLVVPVLLGCFVFGTASNVFEVSKGYSLVLGTATALLIGPYIAIAAYLGTMNKKIDPSL